MNSRQRMDLTEEEIIRRIPDKAEYLAPANEIEIQTRVINIQDRILKKCWMAML